MEFSTRTRKNDSMIYKSLHDLHSYFKKIYIFSRTCGISCRIISWNPEDCWPLWSISQWNSFWPELSGMKSNYWQIIDMKQDQIDVISNHTYHWFVTLSNIVNYPSREDAVESYQGCRSLIFFLFSLQT